MWNHSKALYFWLVDKGHLLAHLGPYSPGDLIRERLRVLGKLGIERVLSGATHVLAHTLNSVSYKENEEYFFTEVFSSENVTLLSKILKKQSEIEVHSDPIVNNGGTSLHGGRGSPHFQDTILNTL